MPTFAELSQVERAEELFELLEVPFDPKVLARGRVHVLRLCGAALAHEDAAAPHASEGERIAALRDALRRAHELVARSAATPRGGGCAGCGDDRRAAGRATSCGGGR